ncbi:MAG: hypothetical protein E6G34_11720 [Actinobacteria bacterium]|nr:MAG: hypothetical protein E6G34_11720 [Actinomycetota bacterium]
MRLKPTRRTHTAFFAALGLIALAAPAVASAEEIPTPTIKVKAKAVPIPGFPGTGNFYGKGAAVESTFEIEGSGYGATPQNPKGGIPPLSAVNVFLPKGVKLHPQGFAQCSEATLKSVGPSGCPKKAVASPTGSVLGEVTFGSERVPEEATLQAFFAPGGGLLFFTHGSTPVSLEIVSTGHWVRASGKYSWELKTLVPPVASVPGAPLASARKIHIKVGAAFRKHGKVVPYGTVPKKGECPHGGFFGKVEVTFGGSNSFGEFGIPPITVTKVIRVPCPKR